LRVGVTTLYNTITITTSQEICLTFQLRGIIKEIIRQKYERSEACINQLKFYKSWVVVCDTSAYTLDRGSQPRVHVPLGVHLPMRRGI